VPGVGVRSGAGPGKEAEGGLAGGAGSIPRSIAVREGLVPRGVGPSSFLDHPDQVRRPWNYRNRLCDDGMSHRDDVDRP
jgi:hypothetical protein